MIYISTSCVKKKQIKDSVLFLADNGFKNIELSGGTEFYEDLEYDLIDLQKKYNLNYICHNYFPPPKKHFVLNLASLNDDIYEMSLDHLKTSLSLSKKLGAKKFGFHAGFFIDIEVKEIGKKIKKKMLFEKESAYSRFFKAYDLLLADSGDVDIYIENNVFSISNFDTYKEKVFMLTNSKDFYEMLSQRNINLLLDIAHLKVSSNTEGMIFENELNNLINRTDYIHISDNDGLHDLNNQLCENSNLVKMLKRYNLQNKDITIEVYDSLDNIRNTYNILKELKND